MKAPTGWYAPGKEPPAGICRVKARAVACIVNSSAILQRAAE
jgi:hypothetical protein